MCVNWTDVVVKHLRWEQQTAVPKTILDESINWGLVCAHMHSIAQTQKNLTFMSYTGECWQQKRTQHLPPMKMECGYHNGWIKKQSHTQKSHPKSGEPQRYSWGKQPKKKKKKFPVWKLHEDAELRTPLACVVIYYTMFRGHTRTCSNVLRQ